MASDTMPKIVHTVWVDSSRVFKEWAPTETFKPHDLRCQSVGWLIHEDDDSITLVSSLDALERQADTYLSGGMGMTIPKRAILARSTITDLATMIAEVADGE